MPVSILGCVLAVSVDLLLSGLFNLRGSDIKYNPVFFSYAIVTLDSLRFVEH